MLTLRITVYTVSAEFCMMLHSRCGPLWVKNGPDALEMGRRYYPRKQTSVSYAADCEGIRCYGGGPSRPTSINPAKRLDRDHCRRALTWRNASLIASSIEPCRRQPRRIAPRQKSKGLLELSNPSKRRSTDHETVVPSFWGISEPNRDAPSGCATRNLNGPTSEKGLWGGPGFANCCCHEDTVES